MQSTQASRQDRDGTEIDEDELLRAALSAWADQTSELLQWIDQ